MSAERLKVVLCWHMHQPLYRDAVEGAYRQPWTYLHAIKDYVDMAVHLEQTPGARAVVNFAPTLLEQLADYAAMLQAHLERGEPLRDPLLAALAGHFPRQPENRAHLIGDCLRANRKRLIDRFAPFAKLADIGARGVADAEFARYLSDDFLGDLCVWYHLAWLGETVRRSDSLVSELIDQGGHFSAGQRTALLRLVLQLVESVVPRYRRLAENGRVELSVTPYAHPIMPLMLDFESAREAMPEALLPHCANYPGARERVQWHIAEGIRVFEQNFGFRPAGCWPAEGSIGNSTLDLLAEAGFRWIASGETVLHNSLRRLGVPTAAERKPWLHQAWTYGRSGLHCYFRDDGLSDLIGFNYADWHADDAVANLVQHLTHIAEGGDPHHNRVVSIILDGENAWEYYPENGYYFLTALYRELAAHPRIELTTFEASTQATKTPEVLPSVVAGSWVYGTFSTWIGDPGKNRGWELLVQAKQAYDLAPAEHRTREAERQLAICEGSDWFWWFGDYNPADAVRDFDQLYRGHLAALYRLLGGEPPPTLKHPVSEGAGAPESGGVMRRGQA